MQKLQEGFADVVRLEKGHTEGLQPQCDGTSRATDRIGEGPQDPEAITTARGRRQ